MNFRLKTSQATADSLRKLQKSTGLTPNVLARVAVSLALKQVDAIINPVPDQAGLDFNRSTLTGEFDNVFKVFIAQRLEREISDEEYFPDLFNSYLDAGIVILTKEYQYAGNYEKLITNLLSE